MTINELQMKVKSAEEKVVKIETIIEKHTIAKDKKQQKLLKIVEQYGLSEAYSTAKTNPNWYRSFANEVYYNELWPLICDIEDKDRSIKESNKKLEDAKKVLNNWIEKLRAEKVKQQYIQDNIPEVIKEFLYQWKLRIFDYIQELGDHYTVDILEYRQFVNKLYYQYLIDNKEAHSHYFKYHNEEYDPNEHYSNIVSYRAVKVVENSKVYLDRTSELNYKYSNSLFKSYKSYNFDNEWLNKVLTEEMNNKLVDLMTRVSKITGEIIDASNLSIVNGELNGYIIGKDGNATVETIGAGGYNEHIILDSGRHGMCYHYRTLVKPKKS